jgi:hypothetical protein
VTEIRGITTRAWAAMDRVAVQRITALQQVILDAVDQLKTSANQADWRTHRILHRAYVQPAPTLERAAEALALTHSTFRRHLTAATERLTQLLWEQKVAPDARHPPEPRTGSHQRRGRRQRGTIPGYASATPSQAARRHHGVIRCYQGLEEAPGGAGPTHPCPRTGPVKHHPRGTSPNFVPADSFRAEPRVPCPSGLAAGRLLDGISRVVAGRADPEGDSNGAALGGDVLRPSRRSP